MRQDEASIAGFAGSPNDVYWEIFLDGTTFKLGESKFHLSCSDDEMDGPEDCDKLQGDGKSDDDGFVNLWQLDLLAGNGQTLDCTPQPPAPAGPPQGRGAGAGPGAAAARASSRSNSSRA